MCRGWVGRAGLCCGSSVQGDLPKPQGPGSSPQVLQTPGLSPMSGYTGDMDPHCHLHLQTVSWALLSPLF